MQREQETRSSILLSVIVPVHAAARPSDVRAALGSLSRQSWACDEVVVVEDGPLTADLADVLDEAASRLPIVRECLPVNQGPGAANQAGLVAARGTWIAKLDSDDVAHPDRFDRQMSVVTQGDVDVIGSAMNIVDEDGRVVAVRSAPETPEKIAARLKWNNPMNHSTTVYRRSLAVRVGGYPAIRQMEDYVFFARLWAGGARMLNLPDPLVDFRAGDSLVGRRVSRDMGRYEREVQAELVRLGVVSPSRAVATRMIRQTARRLPSGMARRAYELTFHHRAPR